jgi:NAD(P)H-hydrate epimerase
LVGSGNNGGDALIALDYLQSWGWKSTALICRKRQESDPLVKRFGDNGGRLEDWWTGKHQNSDIDKEIITADLLLDGVLGTGITLPLKDPIKTLLKKIKDRLEQADDKPIVVAVDCPSGIDCNTGQVDPACIPADLTVTMAAIKKGLFEFPAYQYLGDLRLVDIGLPEDLPELKKITREIITRNWVKAVLPARPPDGHKGIFGTTLIIGGSVNYPGAAILAGDSAYHSGTGLVTIAVPSVIYEGVIGTLPEATWIKLDDFDGVISESALSQISSSLDRPTACWKVFFFWIPCPQ